MTTPSIGVVCGIEREAEALGRLLRDPRSPNLRRVQADPRLLIWLSGAETTAAQSGAALLVSVGVRALVSFGLAGGLAPALRPGDLVRPSEIVDDRSGAVFQSDGPADATPIDRLVQTNRIVSTPEAKAGLRRRHAADAVDMESAAVAAVAAEQDIAFFTLRAIGDAHDRTLPPAALVATRPDGGLALGRVLGSLMRRPTQLPGLLALGRDADRGIATLKHRAPAALDTIDAAVSKTRP